MPCPTYALSRKHGRTAHLHIGARTGNVETIYDYDWADKNAKLKVGFTAPLSRARFLAGSFALYQLADMHVISFVQPVQTLGASLASNSLKVWGKVKLFLLLPYASLLPSLLLVHIRVL